MELFLNDPKKPNGIAANAVISMKEKRRLKTAQPAVIRRLILKSGLKTTKTNPHQV